MSGADEESVREASRPTEANSEGASWSERPFEEGSDDPPRRSPLRGDETQLFRSFNRRLVRSVQRLVNTSPDIVDDACAFALMRAR